MKIYILGQDDYEGLSISSVYSTKEKALEALDYEEYLDESDIHEFEIDPIPSGKKFKTYYYCNFDPTAKESIWGGKTKIDPEKFIPFDFTGNLNQTIGYGLTPEEAEENSRKAQSQLHPVWQVWEPDKYSFKGIHHSHPSLIYGFDNPKLVYAVHEDYNVAKIAIDEYVATGKLSPFLTVPK